MIGFAPDGGLTAGGVTPLTSLGLSAMWRGLDVLSNGVSQLPWTEVRGNLELPASRLVQQPSAFYTRREWTSLVVSTLALFDYCYLLRVGGYDAEGVPLGLWPLDPGQVSPAQIDYYSFLPPTQYRVGQDVISADELVILRRSPTPCVSETFAGVLNLARTTFAAALAAERYASRYWQSGGSPTTVLETDARLSDPEAVQLSDRWRERRSKGPDHAPVLSSGLKARSFGADPTQESAVEARRELVADVGRFLGIPTAILNAPAGDSETYATTESQGVHLHTYTLSNYIGAIEDGISGELPGGRRLLIDPSKLTRGSSLTRAQVYQLATGGRPWMDPGEVRDAEGLPPREIAPAPTPAPQPAMPPAGG